MAGPNKSTAAVLDALVKALDVARAAPDVALALSEFALGIPASQRDLDLCWGFATVAAKDNDHKLEPFVMSRGLLRFDDDLTPYPSLISASQELVVDVESLLGTVPIADAYAFGSVFLQVSQLISSGTITVSLEPVMVRGGDDQLGKVLFVARDVSLDEAITWLSQGIVPSTVPPESDDIDYEFFELELVRYVVDIVNFDPDEPENNQLAVHVVDLRKPRGWGGYAEENLAAFMSPMAVTLNDDTENILDKIESAVQTVILQWVHLPSWVPNFLDFWQDPQNELPPRLKQYLIDDCSLILD